VPRSLRCLLGRRCGAFVALPLGNAQHLRQEKETFDCGEPQWVSLWHGHFRSIFQNNSDKAAVSSRIFLIQANFFNNIIG
jgi:hypothetical protein